MENVKTTRRQRNIQINRLELAKPFVFYTIVVAALNTAVLLNSTPSLAATAGFLGVGLLTWSLYEYSAHRWVLHRVPKKHGFNLPGNITHLTHHANPHSLRRLTVQLNESIPISAGYCVLALIVTGSWQSATFLYTGLIAGYFFYEYLDFQAHHGAGRNRVIRYFRANHLLHHHYDAKVRYGVTSPLFDYIFGTYRLPERRPTRDAQQHKAAAA